MFDTKSEKLVTILGGLSVLFLASSVFLLGLEGDEFEILALVNTFNHFILVIVALPFLLQTLFEQESASKVYVVLLLLQSILNAIFVFLIALQLPKTSTLPSQYEVIVFLFLSLLELLPVYLTLYKTRSGLVLT